MEIVRRSPFLSTLASWTACSKIESTRGVGAGIALVNQHRPTPQKVAVAIERQVKRGIEQRMAGADEGGERLALRCDQGLLKGDALVARQHRLAHADQTVAVAHRRRNMGDLIAARLALARRAAELLECFEEE